MARSKAGRVLSKLSLVSPERDSTLSHSVKTRPIDSVDQYDDIDR
ncbi:hypothetical protein [Serratia fonticola]